MKSKGGGGGSTMSLNDFHRMMSLIFTVVMLISLQPWLLDLLVVVVLLLDDESLRERLLGRESTEGDFLIEVKKEMLLMVFMSIWKGEFDGGDDDLSSISMRVCMLVGFLGNDLKPLEEQEFRLSVRKSFSILGLRSIELNLLSCCTCVLILKSE